MTDRGKPALLVVSLAVVAVVSAPVADARPTCRDMGVTTVCETAGSVAIKSRPGTVAPPANRPVIPWLGLPGARR